MSLPLEEILTTLGGLCPQGTYLSLWTAQESLNRVGKVFQKAFTFEIQFGLSALGRTNPVSAPFTFSFFLFSYTARLLKSRVFSKLCHLILFRTAFLLSHISQLPHYPRTVSPFLILDVNWTFWHWMQNNLPSTDTLEVTLQTQGLCLKEKKTSWKEMFLILFFFFETSFESKPPIFPPDPFIISKLTILRCVIYFLRDAPLTRRWMNASYSIDYSCWPHAWWLWYPLRSGEAQTGAAWQDRENKNVTWSSCVPHKLLDHQTMDIPFLHFPSNAI